MLNKYLETGLMMLNLFDYLCQIKSFFQNLWQELKIAVHGPVRPSLDSFDKKNGQKLHNPTLVEIYIK